MEEYFDYLNIFKEKEPPPPAAPPKFWGQTGGVSINGLKTLKSRAMGEKTGEHYIEKICVIYFHHIAFTNVPFGVAVQIFNLFGKAFDQTIKEAYIKENGYDYGTINYQKYNITLFMLKNKDDNDVVDYIKSRGYDQGLIYMWNLHHYGKEMYDSVSLSREEFDKTYKSENSNCSLNKQELLKKYPEYSNQICSVLQNIENHLKRISNINEISVKKKIVFASNECFTELEKNK